MIFAGCAIMGAAGKYSVIFSIDSSWQAMVPPHLDRYAVFMVGPYKASPLPSSVLLGAVGTVSLGLALMACLDSPAFYIGSLVAAGGLVFANRGVKGLFPKFDRTTWDAAAWMFFSSLAWVVITGVILNAAGQRTFSDGFFTSTVLEVPFSVLGLQSAAIIIFLCANRYFPLGGAPLLSATLIGLYQAVSVGWDLPRLFFVFIPIELIYLHGYSRTRNFAAVLTARGTFAMLVVAMQAVPYANL